MKASNQVEPLGTPPDDQVLLISGPNSELGGIFALDAGGSRTLDRIATHGLAVDNGMLYRVISCSEHAVGSSDLIVYDSRGVVKSIRLDSVRDVHDVMPVHRGVLVVSSIDNAVYLVRDDGKIEPWWHADAPADAWHVNCVTSADDDVYGTAFGRFTSHRAWSRAPNEETGVLMRLPGGETVLNGLIQPHTPRRVDGMWVVCNSYAHSIVAYDDQGAVVRQRGLNGYTRGLAVCAKYLYVGESAARGLERVPTARVTVLKRSDWTVQASVPIDATEIYDIVLAPRDLAAGVEIGFRTNPSRVEQEDQIHLFTAAGVAPRRLWATGDPLPSSSLRARIDATLPQRMAPNAVQSITCRLTNLGGAIYVTAPPNPIHICYRWHDDNGNPVGEGTWIHTPLPRSLAPGETIDAAARIAAPGTAGTYTLSFTLLQEGVAWFDDLDATSGVQAPVVVG